MKLPALIERGGGFGLLAGLGSAALLLGAFGFQYIGGLAPCALCLWQRWPHAAAILCAALGLRVQKAWLALLGAASAATSAGIGIFHTGVERGFWKGLSSCSGNLDISKMSPEAALDALMAAKPVKCDEVAWQMAGLSMASWNAILSLGLVVLWLMAARRHLKK